MSDVAPLDAIEPVGSGAAARPEATPASAPDRMTLSDLSALSNDVFAAGTLSRASETAMTSILEMPGARAPTPSLKESLTGGGADGVSQAKTDMVADTATEGSGGDATQDGFDAMIARTEKLYADMTVFQVAWSIARRVQQDTAQLLRGQ